MLLSDDDSVSISSLLPMEQRLAPLGRPTVIGPIGYLVEGSDPMEV